MDKLKAISTYNRVLESYRSLMLDDRWDWDKSPPKIFGPSFYQGSEIFVPGDGHTRIQAAGEAGRREILCEIKPGGVREAILYSVGPANRHFLSNLLSKEDLIRRVQTALKDRELWGWSNKRLVDYCDDTRGRLKISHVKKVRECLLGQWAESDPVEYSWRQSELSRLRDLRPNGGEYIAAIGVKYRTPQPRLNLSQLSATTIDLVEQRAKLAGMSEVEWIETAILSVDSMLVERQIIIDKLNKLEVLSPETLAKYRYLGGATKISLHPDGEVLIDRNQSLELVELSHEIKDDCLPVRAANWGDKYALIAVADLEWIPT